MALLAVVIAKSGIALLDLLPREWEVVVADYSRLDQRGVAWWSYPSSLRYDKIVIVDRNVVTGLTQRKIELALREQGVEGPVFYAGNPKTLLGYQHLNLLLAQEGIVPKPEVQPPADLWRMSKYMIALVGLPAAGKTMMRNVFAYLPGCSVYKWGRFLRASVEETFGPMTREDSWDKVQRFTNEVEARDKTAVARKFLETSGINDDPATFAVVDGIKSREQIIYASYATRRPVIVVEVRREEKTRLAEVLKRGDPDDQIGEEKRMQILASMGALDVIQFADFMVNTTGCQVDYDEATSRCRIRFAQPFLSGFHNLLSWCFISGSPEATEEMVCGAAWQVARDRGFKTLVEVVDG